MGLILGKHKPSYEELEKQIAELKNRLKIEETRMPPRTPAHGADDETPRTQDETGDKYKWLFENEPAALVLVDAQTLRFMDVNIAACKLFGRSREEFLQLTVTDISAEPADSMRVMSSTEERKTVNIPLRMCKKKDGTVFPVDLSLIVFPLKGKKTVYGVFRDISEQKKMEAELRESEERFRSIIENSGAGYFFIDSAGILRNVNNAWLKLYGFSTPEEIIGRDFTEVQAPEDVESAKDFANGILQGKKEYMRGVFSRKGNASEIGYNTFSAWPVIKNNAAIGIEGFVIDTTEQVKAEEIIRNFAKFPSENPNPVFRVNREGAIVFAN